MLFLVDQTKRIRKNLSLYIINIDIITIFYLTLFLYNLLTDSPKISIKIQYHEMIKVFVHFLRACL